MTKLSKYKGMLLFDIILLSIFLLIVAKVGFDIYSKYSSVESPCLGLVGPFSTACLGLSLASFHIFQASLGFILLGLALIFWVNNSKLAGYLVIIELFISFITIFSTVDNTILLIFIIIYYLVIFVHARLYVGIIKNIKENEVHNE